MYYVLRELRGPSLLIFKECPGLPPYLPPPTSNLINNIDVLHVMKCHLFQVCSCCFRFSNMEMFAPKAAMKSDKELCCNSAAIKSSRGVFKIHTVMESRKVMWDESLLICHHVHRDLRVAHTMGRRSNWCLFMGGNDSLGRYIEDFQSSFGLDFLALSPINSHLTERSRTWWLKCSASLRLSDVR